MVPLAWLSAPRVGLRVPAAFLALFAPRLGAQRVAVAAVVRCGLLRFRLRRPEFRSGAGPGVVRLWCGDEHLERGARASAGCFALRSLGWSVPPRPLEHARVRRAVVLLPVALLAALVVVQAFADGRDLRLDARAAGLAVAVVAIVVRAPFLVVVVLAAATAALLRAV